MTTRFNFGQNTDKFYENVFKEFGKSRIEVHSYVEDLREWAKSQPHFPEIPNEQITIFIITTCKFSIEKAKRKLDMYYSVRNLMPEVFSVDPLSPEMILQTKACIQVPLPKVTENNERILYWRLNPKYGPDAFIHRWALVQGLHVMELLMHKDLFNNTHFIFDNQGFTLAHSLKTDILIFKKMNVLLQEVMCNRVASICLVNLSPTTEIILNKIILHFLPEKIKNRLIVDRSVDSIFEKFGKTVLPNDIGGEEKSLEELVDMLHQEYEKMKPRFDELMHMTTNEAVRPSKLENDDILGYYGNFKQINLD